MLIVTGKCRERMKTELPDPSTAPHHEPPKGFFDFSTLVKHLAMSERSLREAIRKGDIPSIRLPGGRKHLFFWPDVESALRRRSTGNINKVTA